MGCKGGLTTRRPQSPADLSPVPAGGTVILVPGLGFAGAEFALLARRLRRANYSVRVFSHFPWSGSLAEKSERLAAFSRDLKGSPVHYVGHSMGGNIVLQRLALFPEVRGGRVVLLGSPVNGSFCAESFSGSAAGRLILGRCMRDVMRTRFTLPRDREVGGVAGRWNVGVGTLVRLPAPADGAVRVAEALCDGMRDTVVLPLTHTSMLFSRRVASMVATFLECGTFSRV